MRIQTPRESRREIVGRISERLGIPARYEGAPGFAYTIGEITVERDGGIVSGNDALLESLKPMLVEQGWLEAGPVDEQAACAEDDLEADGPDASPERMDIVSPLRDWTVTERIQKMIARRVVVLICVFLPIPVVIPDPRKLLEGRGLPSIQKPQESLVERFAPVVPSFGRDEQRLCQQVLLGVDDVHQISERPGRVLTPPDVDVNSTAAVRLGASAAQFANEFLHRLDVPPATHGADEFCAFLIGPVDAAVRDELPIASLREIGRASWRERV